MPSRGIIGLNNTLLTLTAGEAIMAHRFLEYQPWKGVIEKRQNGSLIAGSRATLSRTPWTSCKTGAVLY